MIFPALWALLLMQSPFVAAPEHYKLELDNEWVQIVRVSYHPREISKLHDHPERPTVMIYTTDGGPLQFRHKGGEIVNRPPVKAGGIRFTRGAAESHVVEYMGDQPTECVRVDLKTEPIDRAGRDVRIAPDDRTPFENGQIRIARVTCAANSACPASLHPEDPAVIIRGSGYLWLPAGAPPVENPSGAPVEQIRIEFKSKPAADPRGQSLPAPYRQ